MVRSWAKARVSQRGAKTAMEMEKLRAKVWLLAFAVALSLVLFSVAFAVALALVFVVTGKFPVL